MKYALLVLLLAGCLLAHAQESEQEFGKISQEEIQLTSYAADPDAEAVVLFDLGESKFIETEKGYDIRFTHHKRVKIFKKEGFNYAEISIPLYEDGYGAMEVITSVEAITNNYENGKWTRQELDPSTIYVEQFDDHWKMKKFVFPNIKEGSIVEYRYVLETPFHENLPDWTFQDKIPTMYSEYEVSLIPFYEYIYIPQGLSKFDHKSSEVATKKRKWGNVAKSFGRNVGSGIEFHDYVHTYVMKAIPAFKDESYISSINDYIMKMDFQLTKYRSPTGGADQLLSTWPKLNKDLLKHEKFGKYLNNCSRYAKEILDKKLKIGRKSDQENSIRIIDYVKNKFTWNGSDSKYASQSAKEFFKNKLGNSADINLFLVALLNEAGVEAVPVILSTRDHGKIKTNYPFEHFTNYVIVLVKTSSPFLSDGAEQLLQYNRLPIRCLNESGLLVSDAEQDEWVMLEYSKPSHERHIISMKIDPETLNTDYKVAIQSTEYDAYSLRSEFKNDTAALKAHFSKKIGAVDKIRTAGYGGTKRFSIALEGKLKAEKQESNLVLNPFLNLAITENGLTQKERTYPVDFIYSSNQLFQISISVPSQYEPTVLSQSFHVDDELAEINIDYTFVDDVILIKGNYHFKKQQYSPAEYTMVKQHLDTVVQKFNELLVLEKQG